MKRSILIAVLLAAVMAGAADQPKTIDSKAAFARLKQLAGEWQSAQAADGKTSHLSYRVIADGSAVEERFTGAPGEMLTVYTLSGDRLLLTHYCMAHNQPRMEAHSYNSASGSLDFDFLDATGLASPGTGHMHSASFQFIDNDHFRTTWQFVENGKPKFNEPFEYTRVHSKL